MLDALNGSFLPLQFSIGSADAMSSQTTSASLSSPLHHLNIDGHEAEVSFEAGEDPESLNSQLSLSLSSSGTQSSGDGEVVPGERLCVPPFNLQHSTRASVLPYCSILPSGDLCAAHLRGRATRIAFTFLQLLVQALVFPSHPRSRLC